jgi:FKBP-type peptidyl-prolyl cis-trans isomerase FklB
MTRRWTLAAATLLVTAAAAAAQEPAPLKTDKEKLSYALGMDLGTQFAKQAVDIDPEVFARALKDAMTGGKMLMTEADARVIITALQQQLATKQAAMVKELGAKNLKEGAAFLAANGKKEDVVTLPSGLQYKALTTGSGKRPAIDDSVVCHYRGTLIDGKEFDSSYRRNQPATLQVKAVIKGWQEALQLMPVGSKWQLFIPPQLAYGERGAGADIGPNATLIFEVELLEIKDKAAPK